MARTVPLEDGRRGARVAQVAIRRGKPHPARARQRVVGVVGVIVGVIIRVCCRGALLLLRLHHVAQRAAHQAAGARHQHHGARAALRGRGRDDGRRGRHYAGAL
jgi:hypothetical protein